MPILRKSGIIRTRHKNATGADTKLKFGTSKLFGTKKVQKISDRLGKGKTDFDPRDRKGGKQPAL